VTDRKRGVFVVFEGVEGAGKSTQASRLSRRLDRHGVAHELAREPGRTEVGERIRSLVLDPGVGVSDETELLLMLAARAELVRGVVEPALSRGEVVIADRYELSTFAYQGVARGLGLDRVRDLNRFATGGLEADLTILLEVGPEEARRRRGDAPGDRMEEAGDAFHRRVAGAYARLAARDDRIVTVDAAGSEAEVEARVADELGARWPGVFPASGG
jgi:dTMP kinase